MRPRKARIAAFNPKDPALFQQVFRDTDPGWTHLLPTQAAIEAGTVPLWYPDLKDGLRLKPIRIDCSETVDAQDTWLGETRNTLQFKLGRKGTQSYQVGAQWLRMRLSGYCGAKVFQPDTTTRETRARLTQGYTALGLTVQQDIQPGAVKETITIDAAPEEYSDGSLVLAWAYQSPGLTPRMDGERVAWSTKKAIHLYSEVVRVWDATGAKVPARYRVARARHQLEIAIAEADLEGVTWPLTVDPTVTTVQADATANRSPFNLSSGDEEYDNNFSRIVLPDGSSWGSLVSATFKAYTLTFISSQTVGVQCDEQVFWDNTATAATLEGFTFSAATDSVVVNAQDTWFEWDILGAAGVNGIAKIYGDDSSPTAATIRLNNGQDYGTTDDIRNGVFMGSEASNDMQFAGRNDVTFYQRIEIVYAAPAAPPTTEFSADDTTPDEGQNVTFTDLSNDNGSAITDWAWVFGDGGESTQINPVHKYSTPGTYTVSLTTTNAFGSDTETKVDYIVVADVPESDIPLTGNVTLAKVRYSTNDGSTFTSIGGVTKAAVPEGATDAIEMTNTDITDNHRLYDYGWSDGGEASWTAQYTEARYTALRALVEVRVLWSVQWTDPEHTVVDPEQRFYGYITAHPTINTETEDRWTISLTVKATSKPEYFQGS